MAKMVLFRGSGGEEIYLNPLHVEAVIAGDPYCQVKMASGAFWNLETRAEDAIGKLNSASD